MTDEVLGADVRIDFDNAPNDPVTGRLEMHIGPGLHITRLDFLGIAASERIGPVSDTNAAANAIVEQAANGTVVGITANATDPTFGDTVTYSLDDDAGGRFTIHTTTGVVTVANGTLLDFGISASHQITVRATSSDTSFSTADFTIEVEDNIAPVITSNGGGATAGVNAAENQTAVTTVTATDANTGDTKTFSISGGDDSAKFEINSSSGVLTFVDAPDFEAPTDTGANNIYEVTVRVTDHDGLFDEQAISVTVTDVSETTNLFVAQGVLTAPAGTGEQSYSFTPGGSDPAWVPKVIIFYSNRQADGAAAADAYIMRGWAVGNAGVASPLNTQEHAICAEAIDNSASGAIIVGLNGARSIFMNTAGSTVAGVAATLVNFTSNGFTLNWTATIVGTPFHWIALGGDAIEFAFTNTHIMTGTGTGNLSMTGLVAGETSKVALFMAITDTVVPNPSGVFSGVKSMQASFGAAVDVTHRWASALFSNDASATADAAQGFFTDGIAARILTGPTTDGELDFVSHDADAGVTIVPDNAYGTTTAIFVLMLGGADLQVDVHTLTQPAGNGTQTKTGLAFAPDALLVVGNDGAVSGTLVASAHSSFGAASRIFDGQAVVSTSDTHAADPTETGAVSANAKVYQIATGATPTVVADAAVSDWTGDGYTLTHVADGTQRLIGVVALAGAAYEDNSGVTIINDTFTEASDKNLASHVPDTGTSWAVTALGGYTGTLQVNGTNDNVEATVTTGGAGVLAVAAGTYPNEDYKVQASALGSGSDASFGLIARFQDANNYYCAYINAGANNPDIAIVRVLAGVVTTLTSADLGLDVGSSHTYRFDAQGTTFDFYYDGVLKLTATDSTLRYRGKGGFGLGTANDFFNNDVDTNWKIDNFSIVSL